MTHFGFLSTYPPTRCGLATFTEALAGALAAGGARDSTIVRVLDEPDAGPDPVIVGRAPATSALISGDRASLRGAIRALDAADVAIVQHEYGIYGGRDGDEVVDLLKALDSPAIVVLHTVLASPSAHQRSVLEAVCGLAAIVVVMTENARDILLRSYRVNAATSASSPTACPVQQAVPSRRSRPRERRGAPSASSRGDSSLPARAWSGASGRSPQLGDVVARVHYVIAGQTHPKVLAHEGERYRESLVRLIDDLGLTDTVTLDDRYLDPLAARRTRIHRGRRAAAVRARAIKRPRRARRGDIGRSARRRDRVPARRRTARGRRGADRAPRGSCSRWPTASGRSLRPRRHDSACARPPSATRTRRRGPPWPSSIDRSRAASAAAESSMNALDVAVLRPPRGTDRRARGVRARAARCSRAGSTATASTMSPARSSCSSANPTRPRRSRCSPRRVCFSSMMPSCRRTRAQPHGRGWPVDR